MQSHCTASKCAQLIKAAEKNGNHKYKRVARLRTDVVFKQPGFCAFSEPCSNLLVKATKSNRQYSVTYNDWASLGSRSRMLGRMFNGLAWLQNYRKNFGAHLKLVDGVEKIWEEVTHQSKLICMHEYIPLLLTVTSHTYVCIS